jgi:hypothetical protein
MATIKTLQDLFKRYRRPGDLVFAVLFLALSLFLVSQLGSQTHWEKSVWEANKSVFARPAFWPTVALIGMTAMALLHWIGSVSSPRIDGRWQEVGLWLRSLEYAAWFMVYVWVVPYAGYLASTLVMCVLLALRLGYNARMAAWSAVGGLATVLLFKTFLSVKVPGGAIYEYLPNGLRAFMITYF